MKRWNVSAWLLTALIFTAAGGLAPAPAAAAGELAKVWADASGLELEPLVEHGGLVLTMSGPAGLHHRATFGAGETPFLSIVDEGGAVLPDGSYTWELRVVPVDLRRRDGDELEPVATRGSKRTGRFVQSGSFVVLDGALVAGGLSEPGAADEDRGPALAPKATVLANDDGVIRSSLCVGFDCLSFESFGFDTLRLKENNTRLQFDDTSATSSFPTNNWQIRANDASSGGASFLGFVDQGATANSESGSLVFAVEAGAPESALYVDQIGRVGFGTATPVLELHVVDGDTPSLRLEQDGSGSFEPQIWDVAGNELSFFVRDVTHGSALPFRIRSDAPTNSLFIDEVGNVGLGTGAPAGRLDVLGDIAVAGTVDGRDVAADGATLDAHVADLDNPHQVTAAQAGADPAGTAAALVAAHEAAFDHVTVKAGVLPAAAFGGLPRVAAVSFVTPFPAGTSYAVVLTAVTDDDKKTVTPNVLAKDESGFTVTVGLGDSSSLAAVDWLARPVDE
jgi:hypothetical protein